MAELDDGMGSRLNASIEGGGIIASYPLHHPSSISSTSPTFPVRSHHTGSSAGWSYGFPNNVNPYGPQGQGPGRRPSPGPPNNNNNNSKEAEAQNLVLLVLKQLLSGSGSGGRYSGAGYGERGMVGHNPDSDEEGGQGGYAGGWSEEARRMYLAGGPGAQQGPLMWW
ncbi:hypothetical protein K435DRAFT_861875 [Dendrothele bispora CBS 962.96]|uniref:Uncharacterized protein n=1 Tax=Dendrothele bispora (strain CBS 962.96) TaxID=1314807 RepID=A0A4V4HF15_DENBC|nr:hypothetical protein K435DRAFT_861875 [Dendrothele bispora CBS 962.96]